MKLSVENKENFKQKNDLTGLFYLYKNEEKFLISDDYIADVPEEIISYLKKIPNIQVKSENYMGERYNIFNYISSNLEDIDVKYIDFFF